MAPNAVVDKYCRYRPQSPFYVGIFFTLDDVQVIVHTHGSWRVGRRIQYTRDEMRSSEPIVQEKSHVPTISSTIFAPRPVK